MPLPLILGVGAAIAGTLGVGTGIHGAKKMKDAKDTVDTAKRMHERNVEHFNEENEKITKIMDELGTDELKILNDFQKFADLIECIQNRPEFGNIEFEGITLPKYDKEELQKVSLGAGVLLGGMGGAAAGTAGGFAAAGATTAAVMALGTASTGTAIASLSGAALTNATLAALGGGALVAGGGGMALGSAVLGGATLGVGLLVGGVIFNFTGNKLSDRADVAYSEMLRAQEQINKICDYLKELGGSARRFHNILKKLKEQYDSHFYYVENTVKKARKCDWNDFTEQEKGDTENLILLTGMLYKMCQLKLVISNENEDKLNTVNSHEIDASVREADILLEKVKI